MKEIDELKKTVDTLYELGKDWRENTALVNYVAKGNGAILESINRLCKKSNQGNLVRIGLTLIAFPLPIVIDDALGWSFVAAGLIQRRIKKSALYLEDVSETFCCLVKELQEIRQ